MERPIQIGDIVFIVTDDEEYPLSITDIQPTYIIAGDYILTPEHDHWVIQNYPKEHSVRFEAVPSLSEHASEMRVLINN